MRNKTCSKEEYSMKKFNFASARGLFVRGPMLLYVVLFLIVIPLPLLIPQFSLAQDVKQNKQTPKALVKKDKPGVLVGSILQKQKEKQEIMLIDVRKEADFERCRIPGSLNIPLHTIKTKAFLKSKPMALINKGYNSGILEKECLRLMEAGFTDVSFVIGGLYNWGKKGGPLQGDIRSINELNKVSAREFFAEKNNKNNMVVNISENMSPETAQGVIPGTISIPHRKKKDKEFLQEFKMMLRRQAGGPELSALIYNQDGKYQKNIENCVLDAGVKYVYFLKGGLNEYTKFLEQHATIIKRVREKKTAKKCPSCP